MLGGPEQDIGSVNRSRDSHGNSPMPPQGEPATSIAPAKRRRFARQVRARWRLLARYFDTKFAVGSVGSSIVLGIFEASFGILHWTWLLPTVAIGAAALWAAKQSHVRPLRVVGIAACVMLFMAVAIGTVVLQRRQTIELGVYERALAQIAQLQSDLASKNEELRKSAARLRRQDEQPIDPTATTDALIDWFTARISEAEASGDETASRELRSIRSELYRIIDEPANAIEDLRYTCERIPWDISAQINLINLENSHGEPAKALDHIKEAERALPWAAAAIELARARAYELLLEYEAAYRHYSLTAQLAEEAGDVVGQSEALSAGAGAAAYFTDDDMRSTFRRAEELAASAPEPERQDQLMRVLSRKGKWLLQVAREHDTTALSEDEWQAYMRLADEAQEQGREIARQLLDPIAEAIFLQQRADTARRRREFTLALEYLDDAEAALRQHGGELAQYVLLAVQGDRAYCKIAEAIAAGPGAVGDERWEELKHSQHEARDRFTEVGDYRSAANHMRTLAETALYFGRAEDAEAALRSARNLEARLEEARREVLTQQEASD